MQQQVELGDFPKTTRFDVISRDELLKRNAVLEFELLELIREN
jgi:hypothetical protein